MNIQRRLTNPLLILLLLLSPYAHSNIVILNGLTHENTGSPGEAYRGFIEIQNTGSEKKDVKVYLRDYWFSYKGESKHDPAGTLERSNAEWVSYNPQLLTLEPNEKASINFEVQTPNDPNLHGTYWSVLMVEGITPPDTTPSERGVKINTAIRYAVQVITNIGNTGKSDLQFVGLQMEESQNGNVIHVAIENTGDRILKPELSLEIFDGNGNSLGIFKADRRKTFPGTSITSTLYLEGLNKGKYNGVLIADCDEDHIFGTNFTIEL